MAASAACNPLLLPEILHLILSYITGDRGALASATRVNKLWFHHSTPLLWDRAPWEAFMRLEEHHRIPAYASRIRRLVCTRAPGLDISIQEILATNVKRKVDLEAEATRRHVMRQFFNSGTRQVVLKNFITDAFLQDIDARCCNLRELRIDSRYGDLNYATLSHVLSHQLDSLEDIAILSLCSSAISSDLLVRLAGKPTLRSIRVRIMFTKDTLRQIKTTVLKPFRNLQKLYARTASSAVPLLTECIENVTALHLHVVGTAEVLQHVSRLTALKSLEVDFYGRKSFTSAEVMAVQRLDGLATLRLCDARHKRRHLNPGVGLDLSPQDFEHLLSKIGSRLVHFEFGLPCIIVDALYMVARHCPLVRSFQMRHSPCHLPAPTDSQWPGAMCPEVRLLVVRSIDCDLERDSNDTQRASAFAQRLRALMPELKYPMLTRRKPLDRLIVDLFLDSDPYGVFRSKDNMRYNGCPRDGCVGYGISTRWDSEEEASEDYDRNEYASHESSDEAS